MAWSIARLMFNREIPKIKPSLPLLILLTEKKKPQKKTKHTHTHTYNLASLQVLLNRGTTGITMSVTWSEIGLPVTASQCTVRDVIAKQDLAPAVGGTVPTPIPKHHVQMLRIKCPAWNNKHR